jgi:hypothetical protein
MLMVSSRALRRRLMRGKLIVSMLAMTREHLEGDDAQLSIGADCRPLEEAYPLPSSHSVEKLHVRHCEQAHPLA